MGWNRGDHARKFLVADGRYRDRGTLGGGAISIDNNSGACQRLSMNEIIGRLVRREAQE